MLLYKYKCLESQFVIMQQTLSAGLHFVPSDPSMLCLDFDVRHVVCHC